MAKISAIINTLNEEENLPRALSSLKDFIDEIVVVDMKSDDKTQETAKIAGARVFEHARMNYVEPARNFAISKASGDWVLILDADEELPNALKTRIRKIANDLNSADYYRIPRKNIIFGKWIKHSRWWPDYNIRFFKKGSVVWSEVIHSIPMTKGKGVDLEESEDLALIHYHYDSIEQYLERLNRYTTEHAKLLINEGYVFKWQDLIVKPSSEFFSRYFFGQGYKDGLHGLALAGLQAFSELALYLKIWQTQGFGEKRLDIKEVTNEFRKSISEFYYWKSDTLIKEGGYFFERIKRKFKLP